MPDDGGLAAQFERFRSGQMPADEAEHYREVLRANPDFINDEYRRIIESEHLLDPPGASVTSGLDPGGGFPDGGTTGPDPRGGFPDRGITGPDPVLPAVYEVFDATDGPGRPAVELHPPPLLDPLSGPLTATIIDGGQGGQPSHGWTFRIVGGAVLILAVAGGIGAAQFHLGPFAPASTHHADITVSIAQPTAPVIATNFPEPAKPPANPNHISSPAGTGAVTVTKVVCYPNGTGGNPERDADLTLGAMAWHLQQIYPASYFPNGPQNQPSVYLEDGANSDPATHIYGGFSPSVTVSGDIGAISSGQSIHVDVNLFDGRTNTPVPGGTVLIDFKCP